MGRQGARLPFCAGRAGCVVELHLYPQKCSPNSWASETKEPPGSEICRQWLKNQTLSKPRVGRKEETQL